MKGGENKLTYYPSNQRYEKANLLKVSVAFNRKTEPDLVEKMEQQQQKASYLKRLVKEDIEREKNPQETEE